ncbi:MAG TPA: DUF4410 domain-containing protein [Chthoniobacterales bacterium]
MPRSSGAQVDRQQTLAHIPSGRPTAVYVTDFDLESPPASGNDGLLPGGGPVRGAIGRLKQGAGVTGKSSDIVDLMADSLVRDLNQGGLTASRLASRAPVPRSGWVVRGIFTQADQGNRLRRATIGFGAGGTNLQVLVNVADLQHGRPEPFYQLETSASSRKTPGAIVTKNPYVAAAKFVMSKRDLPKNVKKTAQLVAAQILSRAKS